MPLPKVIHLIWIGDQSKRPTQWMETWKQQNPDYEVRIWGNDEVNAVEWALADQIGYWWEREINGAADILRWEILQRHGGLAFDADSICVRPLEDWLIEPDSFAAWENEITRTGLIAAGALGFQPEHPLVKRIIHDIWADPEPHAGMAWEKVGPLRLTNTVRQSSFINLTVYPSHFFFPRHLTGLEYTGAGPVFAKQYWGSTHRHWGVEVRQ
ncbi:glycosyltransferase family 32 protein [Methylobacterium sp. JK268]